MGKTGGGVGSNQYGPRGRSVAKAAQRPQANLLQQAGASKQAKPTATEKIMAGYGNKRKRETVGDRETPPASQVAKAKPARWTCPPLDNGPLILPPRRPSPYARPIYNEQLRKQMADQDMVRRYVRYGLGDTDRGMPGLHQDAGRATMQYLKDRLAEAGMPRTSHLSGGEMAGLIENNHLGSTGFSVAVHEDRVRFHVVVSGKAAGLAYRPSISWGRDDDDEREECEEPVNPDSLSLRIAKIFTDAGLHVQSAKCGGWQTYWDDDVDFDVVCDRW